MRKFEKIRACSHSGCDVITLSEKRLCRRKERAEKILIAAAFAVIESGGQMRIRDIFRELKELPAPALDIQYRQGLAFFEAPHDWAQFHAEHILRRAAGGTAQRYVSVSAELARRFGRTIDGILGGAQ